MLSVLPFFLVLALYLVASDIRLAENPSDKLMPSLSTMGDAIHKYAIEESRRTGEILLWQDTAASLTRLALGLGIAALIGLIVGITTGIIPYLRASFSPFIAALSMIPPLAVLPILFIVFGLGEVSKVVLIVFGVAPFLIRDIAMRSQSLPAEEIIKAQTLGGSTWQIIVRVVLPQMMPRLLDALRLSLGAAWLFLIAAEAIASTDGLGYRIFLVRRYLSMDIILPYVAWITLLAFVMDYSLRIVTQRFYPWYSKGN